MIDTIHETLRRAMALCAAFERLGFDLSRQIFIQPAQFSDGPPAPEGSTRIVSILAIDGDPEHPSFYAYAGMIERSGLEAAIDDAFSAWNALTDDKRNDERLRFVPLMDFYRITQQLIERGIVPPAMSDMMPTGRN